MDAKATLKLFLNALEEKDDDGIAEHARALETWLAKGGFVPPLEKHEFAFLISWIADFALG